jgi:hypothetical protein
MYEAASMSPVKIEYAVVRFLPDTDLAAPLISDDELDFWMDFGIATENLVGRYLFSPAESSSLLDELQPKDTDASTTTAASAAIDMDLLVFFILELLVYVFRPPAGSS